MSAVRRPDRRVVPAGPRREARAAQQRSARRKRAAGLALRGLLVTVPLVVAAWVLLSTPLLSVRAVAVTGTDRLTPAQVRDVADVTRGTPLARVDTDAVVRRLKALRPVSSVEVSRGWPSTLRVRVTERTPVAGLLDTSGVTLVDAQGVAFARARALAPGTVRLQVPRPGPRDATTRAALQVLADLPPSLRGPLRVVRAATPSTVTLVLSGGRQVIWGSPEQTERKAEVTLALLKLPGRTFDVSRPSVVTRR